MEPTLERPPRTIMEVFKILPEGTLAELIEGQLFIFGSAVVIHQRTLTEVISQLHYISDQGLGEVILRPFDIYLDEINNVVQPDIVIILNSNSAKLDPNDHFHGVPDIIVEILTSGFKEYDLIKKKALYEKFGVKEYWIVDPDTRFAMVFELENNEYKLISEEIHTIKSKLLNVTLRF